MGWGAFYLALSAVVIATIATRKRRPEHILGAAILLGSLCVIWNLCHWFVRRPYNQFFPLIDAVTMITLAWVWRHTLNGWKVLLILLFCADCWMHVVFAAQGDRSHHARYAYDLALNVLYLGQLGCVLVPALHFRPRLTA